MKQKIKLNFLCILLATSVFIFFPESGCSANETMCIVSDPRPTVIIDHCDTGVANTADEMNCTISDRIGKCTVNAKNHGQFVKCTALLTGNLVKSGKITKGEKGKIQSCAAKADVPCSDCTFPLPGEPFRYRFETATDPLSMALQKVYSAYITMPTPDTDMVALDNNRKEGIAYLKAHPAEAGQALLEEVDLIGSQNRRLAGIIHLLGHFENETGMMYLFEMVQNPIPTNCPSPIHDEETSCSDAAALRLIALDSLGMISASGGVFARARILDLVNYGDPLIQHTAIKLFYETAGMPRWRAKREMAARLPASKRYLLHALY
jgi:hypothetical protein